MKTKIIVCLAALCGVAAVNVIKNQYELPKAKLTIKVVDDEGNPVVGATVKLVFQNSITYEGMPMEELTPISGIVSAEGGSNSRIAGSVQKEGYYRAGFPFKDFVEVQDGRWLPWNATYTSVLRPMVKPVALYAKTTFLDIPVADQACGYDLMKGDWITPYGQGEVADLVLTAHRHYVSSADFEVKIDLKFSQPTDGIQEAKMPEVGRYSTFRWAREAPGSGYQPSMILLFSHKDDRFEQTANEQQNYFFRVRTIERNGRMISGLYGKIKGGLFLDATHAKVCNMRLTYYLNPTSLDRNLEWDMKQNLLPGLSVEQTPREP